MDKPKEDVPDENFDLWLKYTTAFLSLCPTGAHNFLEPL